MVIWIPPALINFANYCHAFKPLILFFPLYHRVDRQRLLRVLQRDALANLQRMELMLFQPRLAQRQVQLLRRFVQRFIRQFEYPQWMGMARG